MKSAINNQSSVFVNQLASGLIAVAFGARTVPQFQTWLNSVQIDGGPLPLSTIAYIVTAANNLKFAVSKLPSYPQSELRTPQSNNTLPGEKSCQPPPVAR